MILYNITTSNGLNITSTLSKCSLDQFEMMNQVQRTPTIAFYFLLSAFIILTLYIFSKKLQEYVQAKQILYPIYMLIFTSLTLYTFTTFNITEELFNNKIEPILYIISEIGIIYIIWKEKNKIKEFINKIRNK